MKKGSYTVEAAFIMPMCIFIIIALIYVLFVIHDRAYAYVEAGRLAEEYMRGTDGDIGERLSGIKEGIKKDLSRNMFVCRIGNIDVKRENLNLEISINLSCGMRIFGRYDIKNRYYMPDYGKVIRGIEIIK